MVVFCLAALLLPACTTVPVNSTKARPAISSEQQQQIYLQARGLYLDKNYNEAVRLLLPLAQQSQPQSRFNIFVQGIKFWHYLLGFVCLCELPV